MTVNDNFANISSEAGDSPQSRGLRGLHQSFDQGSTEELGQRHRQPNLKHLGYDWRVLTAGLAVRDLNTVDVGLDRRSLDCVVGLGQGLLELVWDDLILNQLLKMRDQSLLRRSGIIQLQPAFFG